MLRRELDYLIGVMCISCNQEKMLCVDEQDWNNYKSGKVLVQDAFPYLSSGEREILVSRICSSCFDDLFPDEEDNLGLQEEPVF